MKKVFAALLCLTMLMGCLPAMADGEAVYTTLYASEMSTLNYLTAGAQWEQTVGANVIDTLVEYDSYGNVIPGLAESWTVNDDATVWTFKLREGQKWYTSAGEEYAEVVAQDFVDGLKWVLTAANDSGVEYAVETAKIVNASAYYGGEVTDFNEVGVKAVDKYTVEYTCESPVPYFLSCLTYGCFMPANGEFLAKMGADFGTATSADTMLYNGAFILQSFVPQSQHVFVKNVNNWDAEHVYIDKIVQSYNSESATISPEMALRGEIDSASLSNDIVDDYKDMYDFVTKDRPSVDYSYFYCFNFDPQYEAEYDPANWLIAVNNANFRHSIMSAFDRVFSLYAIDPDDPESVLQSTVTPATFVSVDGTDFSALPAFAGVAENYFNTEKALAYKEAAVAELTEAGCKFPVQVVLTYRSDMSDWESECQLVKQQLESVLGTDYINVVLYAGPSENFLSATRRAGKYSLMRCNWGADYADPETWTDPFVEKLDADTGKHTGNSYNKMDMMLDTDYAETKEVLNAYYAAVAEAKASVTDTADRYNKFATAEAMLINNAIVIPYMVSTSDYQITKLNVYEGEYAVFGVTNIRWKYQHLNENFVTTAENEAAAEAWREAMGL